MNVEKLKATTNCLRDRAEVLKKTTALQEPFCNWAEIVVQSGESFSHQTDFILDSVAAVLVENGLEVGRSRNKSILILCDGETILQIGTSSVSWSSWRSYNDRLRLNIEGDNPAYRYRQEYNKLNIPYRFKKNFLVKFGKTEHTVPTVYALLSKILIVLDELIESHFYVENVVNAKHNRQKVHEAFIEQCKKEKIAHSGLFNVAGIDFNEGMVISANTNGTITFTHEVDMHSKPRVELITYVKDNELFVREVNIKINSYTADGLCSVTKFINITDFNFFFS